jgi:HEAT repeat protein
VIGLLDDERLVDSLVALLKDDDWHVKGAAVNGLDSLHWKPSFDEWGASYWAYKGDWESCAKIGAPAVEVMIDNLNNYLTGETERQKVAASLKKIGNPAIPALVTTLRSTRDIVRKTAASVLDELGWQAGLDENGAYYWIAKHQLRRCETIGVPAIEPLLNVLRNYSSDFWKGAVAALPDQAISQAVDILILKLSHKDPAYMRTAIEAAQILGSLGDRRAVEPLIAVLQDKGNYYKDRLAAAEALETLGDMRAVEAFLSALHDKTWYVRFAAAKWLVKMYQTGGLDSMTKDKILQMRSIIIEPKKLLYEEHSIDEWDEGYIEYTGIGVEFPVQVRA